MILFPHIIVGAVIGAKIQNFWLIAVLGLISHFIMDRIPHWDHLAPDYALLFKATKQIKYFVKFLILIVIDGFIGLSIVSICLYFKNTLNLYSLKFVIVGIFFTVLPDAFLLLGYLTDKYKISKNYIKFHHFFHFINKKKGKITFLGLFSQIAIIVISLLLLFVS